MTIKTKYKYKSKNNNLDVTIYVDGKKFKYIDISESPIYIEELVCDESYIDYWDCIVIDNKQYDININDYMENHINYFLQISFYEIGDITSPLQTIPIKYSSDIEYEIEF